MERLLQLLVSTLFHFGITENCSGNVLGAQHSAFSRAPRATEEKRAGALSISGYNQRSVVSWCHRKTSKTIRNKCHLLLYQLCRIN